MTSFFVEKINILEYAFGEGGGGHQKAYAVYAFINVDNCERPLSVCHLSTIINNLKLKTKNELIFNYVISTII